MLVRRGHFVTVCRARPAFAQVKIGRQRQTYTKCPRIPALDRDPMPGPALWPRNRPRRGPVHTAPRENGPGENGPGEAGT